MGMRIPPLTIKIPLESNPLKSGILVRRLAIPDESRSARACPGGVEIVRVRAKGREAAQRAG